MHPAISIGVYLLLQAVVCFLSIRCLAAFSAFRRGIRGTVPGKIFCVTGLVLFWVFSLFPVAGAMLPDSMWKYRLEAAGNIWLGFAVYFNGILILLCAAGGIWYAAGRSRRAWIFPAAFAVSLTGSLVLLIYGMSHAQHTVVKEYDIAVEKEAGETDDLRIVLIADLHLGANSCFRTIRRMVDIINEQKADAVLIAGDVFNSSCNSLRDPDRYAEALREIQTVYGTYAVYGNHDVEETLFGGFPISPVSKAFRPKEMEQFFRKCGFTVLEDRVAAVADGMVQVVGRVDGEKAGDGTAQRKSPEEILSDVDPEKQVIVLQHEPVEFRALKENGADLALCGHTHAGQIFPGNLIVPFFNENGYGCKNVSGLITVVTSGIGYYGPPMRVGTNSEITVVNIHFI